MSVGSVGAPQYFKVGAAEGNAARASGRREATAQGTQPHVQWGAAFCRRGLAKRGNNCMQATKAYTLRHGFLFQHKLHCSDLGLGLANKRIVLPVMQGRLFN